MLRSYVIPRCSKKGTLLSSLLDPGTSEQGFSGYGSPRSSCRCVNRCHAPALGPLVCHELCSQMLLARNYLELYEKSHGRSDSSIRLNTKTASAKDHGIPETVVSMPNPLLTLTIRLTLALTITVTLTVTLTRNLTLSNAELQ